MIKFVSRYSLHLWHRNTIFCGMRLLMCETDDVFHHYTSPSGTRIPDKNNANITTPCHEGLQLHITLQCGGLYKYVSPMKIEH